MDEKDKNKIDPEIKENNEEKKDEGQKKPEEIEDLAQIEEEIQNMIREMEMYVGENTSNVKIMTITKEQKRVLLYYSIVEFVLSIVLLFSSIGYIKWVECDKLYQYFILIGGIVIFEFLIRYLIKKHFIRLMIMTFGAIILVAPLIGFVISLVFTPGVEILNYNALFLSFILYLIIKKIIMVIIKGDLVNLLTGIKK